MQRAVDLKMRPSTIVTHRLFSKLIVLAFTWCLLVTIPALGQASSAGNIHGITTDTSGAAMPGTTVTLTSSALIVPRKATASESGNYHFEQLPVGSYSMTFEQTGFQKLVRENIQITAGFSAEINVAMTVGSVSETVTVTSAGPVIDTTSTAVSTNISSTTMSDELPVTRTMQEMVAITPGVVPTSAPDLGGGGIPSFTLSAYGITGQATTLIEGINTRKSSNSSESDFDFTALEEFQVIPTAGTADIALPGVFLNAIVKSGGDRLHGRAEITGQDQTFESNNLTPLLRSQGNTTPQLILNTVQASVNAGGPIIKGKWWIFGGANVNSNNRNALGYFLPNGDPGIEYGRLTNQTAKTTFQLTKNYKLIGFWTQNTAYFPNRFGAATIPYYSTSLYAEPVQEWKGEIQGTPNSRLVVDFFVGHHQYQANYYSHNEAAAVTIPTIFDTATSQNYGPAVGQDRRGRHQTQLTGSLDFLPAGNYLGHHELKVGSTWMFMWTATNTPIGNHINPSGVPGNYVLVFNNGTPTSIRFWNFPITSNRENLNEGGFYAEDTWHINSHVTANIGLRLDRFATTIPTQKQAAAAFGPPWAPPAAGTNSNVYTGAAYTVPNINTGTWNSVAPRFGVAWDITGNGKTVYKASFGRYNWTPGDDFGAPFNPNAETIATYAWAPGASCTEAAAVAGTCDYVPGSVNLNPNGPAFQSLSGGANGATTKLANTALNPNLSEQYSNIYQTLLEHELAPNLSIRGGFTYIQNRNTWAQIPTQIPYGAWTNKYTMYDQGPVTGACYFPVLPKTTPCSASTLASAPSFTIYDLPPGFASLTQTQYVNRSNSQVDHIGTYELTLTKRSANGKWNLVASYTFTKQHIWIVPVITNPNQLIYPLNTTSLWTGHVAGNYRLPWKFNVSGVYQIYSGIKGQRAESVPLPNGGTTAIPVAQYGSYAAPLRALVNLKFERDFHLEHIGTFKPGVEMLNSLNSAAIWGVTTYNSSATYGKISSTDTPRIFRFGLIYVF